MASIQKVLNQRKKTPMEIERDNFEKSQIMHIQKAITNQDASPKEKHIRAIILGTFTDRGAVFFYSMATRSQLQEHPIICWKFFYIVNKIIRNGHHDCLRDSFKHVSTIADLGRLWGHLKQGYGTPTAAFAKLLLQKLRFHRKYITVPGSLSLGPDDLTEIAGNNVNSLFELSVDLLDYLDELMNFQQVVLNSMDKSRSNSMTQQGQCRLTPLIQCVQDSASVYDILVKLLFRLHTVLPADTLSGHRERFFRLYRSLQIFFQTSQTLQYFKNLIQVPTLPDNPPNFMVESELASHRAPVVTLSAVDEDSMDAARPPSPPIEDSLIEINESLNSRQLVPVASAKTNASPRRNDQFDAVFGNDMGNFTFNGQRNGSSGDNMAEINRLNAEIERLKAEHKERIDALLGRIKTLEENVKGLVQLKERYEQEIDELKANLTHQIDNGQVKEEKFKKMKEIYTKLRDEHVDLLRKKATVTKELETEKKKVEEKEQELRSKCDELAHLQHERQASSEVTSGSSQEQQHQLTEAKTRLLDVERMRNELKSQLDVMTISRNELQEKISVFESRLSELEQEKVHRAEHDQALEASLAQSRADLELANQRVTRTEGQLNETNQKLTDLQFARDELDRLRSSLLKTACERGAVQVREAVGFFDSPELLTCKGSAEFLLTRVECVLNEVEAIEGICSEFAQNPESMMPFDFQITPSSIPVSVIDQLVCSIGQFSSRLAECLIQGKATSHSAPSVELGDELVSACKLTAEEGLNFLSHLGQQVWEGETIVGHASSLLAHLRTVQEVGERLRPRGIDIRPEEMGDMVDQEMRSTTEAIEAAEAKFKELLEKSREGMTGIQLEVNERILDSCTQLMNTIRVLVEKSKVLQREIVAEGRGTSTSGEFYKKNHRWTEGLISAAKAVGFGATTLLESADKMLAGEVSFERLMVCSQDIAASTAQLVVASRVKANPKSFSLQQLQTASKEVSKATGNVIASTKTAAEIQEQAELLDFNHLSLTQAKRQEMDSQVRVLQLETEIERERKRLAELRKRHYQLASESERIEPDNHTEASK